MEDMEEGYELHVLDVKIICSKSLESVTSQHIAWCWKSSTILRASDFSDQTEIYGKNIGNSAQVKSVVEVLSLMKQLTLDEQAKLFIESDIASITTNDLCEGMNVESNINVKNGMLEME